MYIFIFVCGECPITGENVLYSYSKHTHLNTRQTIIL